MRLIGKHIVIRVAFHHRTVSLSVLGVFKRLGVAVCTVQYGGTPLSTVLCTPYSVPRTVQYTCGSTF
jgi:hypothetical protein